MSSTRDYATFSRSKSPALDAHAGLFHTGQGGRRQLPPLSSACPTSPSTGPVYSQYAQQRSSPPRHDYEGYGSQWPQGAHGHGSSYEYYPSQERYGGSNYAMYPTSGPIDSRKLPPLNAASPNGVRDERWQGCYSSGMPAGPSIRSPTASYPSAYHTYHGYSMDNALPMAGMTGHERSSSPYPQVPSSYTPPPVSPTSGHDESSTNIKKKRKRADPAQLKILNEVYTRTAFPSTEERLQLAKTLDMSPRSVQIWFQNKRQSMRQTRQSSSSHQAFAL